MRVTPTQYEASALQPVDKALRRRSLIDITRQLQRMRERSSARYEVAPATLRYTRLPLRAAERSCCRDVMRDVIENDICCMAAFSQCAHASGCRATPVLPAPYFARYARLLF